ncbi:tachykinin isoform X2 [Haematobia irritans]|uniref:tachykinin isoform X2 n=1 Tax=Haematobia irritans TaxID=7368 RepID=UPI003F4FEB13
MANRQNQQSSKRRRQLVLSFWPPTSCIMMAVVFMVLLGGSGSTGVNALSGNRLQQQQLVGNEHGQDNSNSNNNGDGGVDNYIMQKSTTELVPSNGEILDDDDEIDLKENRIGDGLPRSQVHFRYPTLTMIKRAPGGFVGMRGKKSPYNDDPEDNDDAGGYTRLTFPWQQLSEAENDGDLIHWNDYAKMNGMRYKKAPTIVYGPRGNKFNMGNGDAYRWQQFLQKLDEESMRSMIMDDFMDSLVNDPLEVQNEITKRAPTGFTGLRGKRLPFREDEDETSPDMTLAGKRGLANTFVGVRGKKDVSHQTFKRSALGGSESSPAGGGAGSKRQRFHDFGNKFVAVRGKKNDVNGNDHEITSTLKGDIIGWSSLPSTSSLSSSYIQSSRGITGNEMRLLYGNNDKRAPTGFLGMRGKRQSLTTDDIQTSDN